MDKESPYWIDGPVPETPGSGEYPDPWKKTKIVGTRVPKVDAYERVSGTAVYPHDVALPEMLHGAILRCPHAHAKHANSVRKCCAAEGFGATALGYSLGLQPRAVGGGQTTPGAHILTSQLTHNLCLCP